MTVQLIRLTKIPSYRKKRFLEARKLRLCTPRELLELHPMYKPDDPYREVLGEQLGPSTLGPFWGLVPDASNAFRVAQQMWAMKESILAVVESPAEAPQPVKRSQGEYQWETAIRQRFEYEEIIRKILEM